MSLKAKNIFRALALCLLAAALPAGCSVISPPAPLKIIALSPYKAEAPACSSPLPVQLVIPAPYGSAGLNTDRIAILLKGREIHYFEGYKWEDSNTGLVQRMLIDALNDSGCFQGAGTGSMALRADYRLEVDVKLMHFVYTEGQRPPPAEVSLLLRLVDVSTGNMLGQHNAHVREGASEGDVFMSMEKALHAAVQSSLEWLRESVSEHLAAK